MKAKLLHEEYSENLLQQNARYRHYANNLERIVLRDEILTRQNFDETRNVKYHQILLPQHLLQELLQSLHGTAHKHPGISKMLQETRQRYYYPSMAKHVKKWVEGCEECARDKRVPNATSTPEKLNLPEWDFGPKDAMQIDLLPNLPPSGGYENVLTAIDVFSRYLIAYPLTDASAINVAKALIDIMTKHAYLSTTLITDKGTAFKFYNHCGDYANFGHNTQMCNNKTSANTWEMRADPCLTENKPQNGMWRISPTMAQILAISSTKSQHKVQCQHQL